MKERADVLDCAGLRVRVYAACVLKVQLSCFLFHKFLLEASNIKSVFFLNFSTFLLMSPAKQSENSIEMEDSDGRLIDKNKGMYEIYEDIN